MMSLLLARSLKRNVHLTLPTLPNQQNWLKVIICVFINAPQIRCDDDECEIKFTFRMVAGHHMEDTTTHCEVERLGYGKEEYAPRLYCGEELCRKQAM